MSSIAASMFLMLAHCGLMLANERIVVDEHAPANGSLLGNQHTSANESLQGNQHTSANGSLLGNQHTSANGSLLSHQHSSANGSLLGNQHSLANESGPSDNATCGRFDRPEIPNRERNCPPPEDIPGCRCREGFGLRVRGGNRSSRAPTSLRVRCSKYGGIQRAFGNLRTRVIRQMTLRNCHGRLPAGLFKGLSIYELELDKGCSFHFLSPGHDELPFQDLVNSLQKLRLNGLLKNRRSVSGRLTGVRLSHLKQLGWLIVLRLDVPVIGPDFFRGGVPRCLHYLNIRWCGVERVDDGAFAGLHSLERLHLQDNKLHDFNRASLELPALKLNDLALNNNQLRELPQNAFSGMPSLRTIGLPYNSIRNLPEATWSPIWNQLQSLDLFENPLFCGRYMDWIKRVKYPRYLRAACPVDLKKVLKNQTNPC